MLVALSIICIYLDEACEACSNEIWILYRGKEHINWTLTVCQTVLSTFAPNHLEGEGKATFYLFVFFDGLFEHV